MTAILHILVTNHLQEEEYVLNVYSNELGTKLKKIVIEF